MQIRRQRPRTAANGFGKTGRSLEAFKDIIIKYNIINDMTRHKLQSGAGAAILTPSHPTDGWIIRLSGPHDRLHHRRRCGFHRRTRHDGRNPDPLPARTGRGRHVHQKPHRRARAAIGAATRPRKCSTSCANLTCGGGCDPERHTLLQQTVAGGVVPALSKPYRTFAPPIILYNVPAAWGSI